MDQEEAIKKFESTINYLNKELGSIRAGRANPGLVENIKVNVYGSDMPINQLANISVVDSSLLTVQPWDKSVIDSVKKAIETADIGINPSVDGALIRLPIPSLTEERRKEFVKLMKQKLEDAKISIRQHRKDLLQNLAKEKKENSLSEDMCEVYEKELQKNVEAYNKKIDEIGSEKEKELMTI